MTVPGEPPPPGVNGVLRSEPDGVVMRVRLTPKASRDHIGTCRAGPDGPYLKAHVRAVPEKGKANAALLSLIARTFGLRLSDMTVRSGHTARLKSVHIAGSPDLLTPALAARLDTLGMEQ